MRPSLFLPLFDAERGIIFCWKSFGNWEWLFLYFREFSRVNLTFEKALPTIGKVYDSAMMGMKYKSEGIKRTSGASIEYQA